MRLFLLQDLSGAAIVHATSTAEARGLSGWIPEESVSVVPHGIDLPNDNQAASAEVFLGAFPQLRGRRVILFLCRSWLLVACRGQDSPLH
jgi:hypothetical protein